MRGKATNVLAAACAMVAAGSARGSAVTVATVGTYAPNPYAASISSITGGTGLGATDLATFQSRISGAFAGNTGGTLNFDNQSASGGGGTFPTNGSVGDGAVNPITATYGVAQSGAMQFYRTGGTSGAAVDANNNNGTLVTSGARSGGSTDGYFGIQGSASFSLTFVTPLSSFGIVHLWRADAGRSTGTLTVHYSDSTTATSGVSDVTTAPQFVGFIAPAGRTILSVDWSNSNSASRFDDLGFTIGSGTTAAATSSAWLNVAGGSWDATSNWSSGVPNSARAVATFGDGTVVLTGSVSVDLPGARQVGSVNFRDTYGYTLSTTGNGALYLDNGTNAATLNVLAGSHSISVPVVLPNLGAFATIAQFSDTLTMGGNLSGAGTLTKDGPGTLVLANVSATHAGTAVLAGRLQVGDGVTAGALGLGPVALSTATVLALAGPGDYTVGNAITGAGGFVSVEGLGTVSFTGANSFGTGSGGLAINGGLLKNMAGGGLPSGVNLAVSGGGTVDLKGTALTIGRLSGDELGTVTNTLATATLTITSAGSSLFAGNIGGATHLTHAGSGTIVLTGSLTYAGNTAVTGGGLLDVQAIHAPASALSASGAGSRVLLDADAAASAHVVAGQFNSVSATGGGTLSLAVTDRPASRSRLLITNVLNIDSTGHVDLANNDLIVRAQSLATITALVAAGKLTSSTAHLGFGPDLLADLGTMANDDGAGGPLFSLFDGVPVSRADVLVKYTYRGDTDLSGTVDGSDLAQLLAGMAGGLSGWANGDTNYDGIVNGTDLNNLLASLTGQGASFGEGGGQGAAVPEPTGASSIFAGVAIQGLFVRRRNRRLAIPR